ncbi:MAG: hypothetical protein JWN64_17 [Parcubacteria group bacterium]|nr:hypothetical protein [Parcubacteria group bacterium]
MKHLPKTLRNARAAIVALGLFVVLLGVVVIPHAIALGTQYVRNDGKATSTPFSLKREAVPAKPVLDTAAYDKKMLSVANNPAPATSTSSTTPAKVYPWPVKAAYPKAGAILPFKRIIAYYGNFYSTKMGALGEYPAPQMLSMLKQEKQNWETADPSTPVVVAIDYIAITAQGSPGKDGKYRLRMPDSQIDHALELAHEVNGIVILDIQVGLSDLQTELPLLEKYLKMPEVHLAIDPEFSMKNGEVPGSVIGTFSSADVNFAAGYLAKMVQENDLPPKVLIVHRFTQRMVTGYANIRPLPEVQIVMTMDGWGSPARKIGTYKSFIYPEPVQFTGFKIFYKNDLKPPSTRLLMPSELVKLSPQPMFIQYQ